MKQWKWTYGKVIQNSPLCFLVACALRAFDVPQPPSVHCMMDTTTIHLSRDLHFRELDDGPEVTAEINIYAGFVRREVPKTFRRPSIYRSAMTHTLCHIMILMFLSLAVFRGRGEGGIGPLCWCFATPWTLKNGIRYKELMVLPPPPHFKICTFAPH